MDFLMECLAIGDLEDGESAPPVDAILNLTRFEYPTSRIYRQVYFPDFEYMQDLSLIGQCTEYIREQIALRHRVLVHCFAGISRSSAICIAYLHECGMSFGEALDFIKLRHPIAQPHEELLRSLHDWYQPLREQGVLL
jgi:histidinol-phosphate aminotransferase